MDVLVTGYIFMSLFTKKGQILSEMTNITFGGNGGGYFDDFETWSTSNWSMIKRISLGSKNGRVSGIQITYGEDIAPHHGDLDPSRVSIDTIEFSDDEFIIGINSWHGLYLNGIQFITNKGYKAISGTENEKFLSVRYHHLLYISGRSGTLIDKLTLHWYEDIDNCTGVPCFNGASCFDLEYDFRCNCSQEFTGTWCETALDTCSAITCYNNGTCINLLTTYNSTCACQPGFTGKFCEQDIDDCAASPCQNNGTCIDGTNQYFCLCQEGYTGYTCSQDIDDCHGIPCFNGGVCKDLISSYHCDCQNGYSGKWCETNINDCTSSACVNNGTCIDGLGNYSCDCLEGFHGQYCEITTDTCVGIECAHNGSCVSLDEAYRCDCQTGYSGDLCQTSITTEVQETTPEAMSKLSFHGYRIPADVNISLLEKTLENLKNYLKVDKKETSVQRRSKISAADDRPSAMITGSILGVTILVLLLSTIVLSDLHVLYRHIVKKNVSNQNGT